MKTVFSIFNRLAIMVTAKKKQAKTKTSKPVRRTSGDLCFWVYEGPVLASIADLKKALKEMSREQFNHHTRERNDFSAWLTHVLRHDHCAKAIARAKTQEGALRALDSCKD